MTALYSLSIALWQTPDSGMPSKDEHMLVACIVVIALAMAAQAVVTIGVSYGAWKTLKEFKDLAADFHAQATPIMRQTTELINDVGPKVRAVSENVSQISYTVREKVDEVGETVSQVNRTVLVSNEKARAQIDHVDRIVSSALETTEEVKETVAQGVRGPLKQVAGLITGVRVGIETLLKNFAPKNDRGPQY
jgi:uncharacterized protein YoxC